MILRVLRRICSNSFRNPNGPLHHTVSSCMVDMSAKRASLAVPSALSPRFAIGKENSLHDPKYDRLWSSTGFVARGFCDSRNPIRQPPLSRSVLSLATFAEPPGRDFQERDPTTLY